MKKLILLLTLVGLLTVQLAAQSFLTPLTSISGDAELVTVDDEAISGKLVMALTGMKGLNSLTIKDTDDQKHKFKAEDVKRLKIKVDKLAKLEIITEQTSNLEKMMQADFSEINTREYVFYERIRVPGKDQFVLVQWLNPGFGERIRVFEKPGAKSGETSVNGVAVKGNTMTACYVIVNGEVREIKKSAYRKTHFQELFGDCEDMVKLYEKPEFDDFAEHILYYDLHCR